jgi:hypothetical protein
MMTRSATLAILTVLLAVSTSLADRDDYSSYGIGLQWVDPVAYGPSLTWDLSSMPLSLQAVIGVNNFPSPVMRARYVFAGSRYLDWYGYGAVGLHEKDNGDEDELRVFGGVGAGAEWDWREASSDLPPILWSLELGLNDTNVSFGFGIHYKF